MPNHLKQSHPAQHDIIAHRIKLAVRISFKYTAGFHTLDYISEDLDETFFYEESTMADNKTPCREVFFGHLSRQGYAIPPTIQPKITELRDAYFFLLGAHLNDALPETKPEPTYNEEHQRLSAEIATIQHKRLGTVA